jgi:hypothetical protein
MKSCGHTHSQILILVVGLALLGLAGCGGASPVLPPRIASDAAKKAIELYDLDKNGYLDAQELEKAPSLRVAFAGSNKITEQDIAARLAKWKETKFGRLQFVVTVMHNGQPLADANVNLVPESFVGSEIQTAVGKTDRTGRASPTVPDYASERMPGVAPGFYRIEITKDGESIPAKYNTATVLGGEVPQMEEGKWVFNLEY